MNLLQSLFGPKRPPVLDEQKKALEQYDAAAAQRAAKEEFERDRTARIATYLQCIEAGGTDCRIDISWEEMARQGISGGQN